MLHFWGKKSLDSSFSLVIDNKYGALTHTVIIQIIYFVHSFIYPCLLFLLLEIATPFPLRWHWGWSLTLWPHLTPPLCLQKHQASLRPLPINQLGCSTAASLYLLTPSLPLSSSLPCSFSRFPPRKSAEPPNNSRGNWKIWANNGNNDDNNKKCMFP